MWVPYLVLRGLFVHLARQDIRLTHVKQPGLATKQLRGHREPQQRTQPYHFEGGIWELDAEFTTRVGVLRQFSVWVAGGCCR